MHNCTECAAEVIRKNKGRFPLTCSDACQKLRRNRLLREGRSHEKTCPVCQIEFTAQNTRTRFCSVKCKSKEYNKYLKAAREQERLNRPDFVEVPCYYCKEPVWKLASRSGKVSHPTCKEQRQRDWNRAKNAKRRRYRYVRSSMFSVISERDEWTCHICGEYVDDSLPSYSRMSPSLDHVIPLSKGGTDDPKNLKLSHFICNVRKGTQIA